MTSEQKATIVRIRGSLSAYLTTAGAAGDGFHCAVGIGIVTNEAFAIGQTALPGPLDEADWGGWMYYRFFDLHEGEGAAVNVNGLSSLQFEVDTKAMRKWEGNSETLVAMLQVVEKTAATMETWFDSRILVKLS